MEADEARSSSAAVRVDETLQSAPPLVPAWLLVIASAAAVATVIGLGIFLPARPPVESPAATADGTTTVQRMDTWLHELGVSFSIETTFPEAVTLSAPTVRVGQVEAPGELWPLDGQDHEGEDLDPLPLHAGARVQIQGWLRPPCDGSDIGVTISVIAHDSDGEQSTPRFSSRNVEAVEEAIRQFCERGPTVSVQMSRLDPNGDATIGFDAVNPGPDEITLEVPAYSDEHVTWASLTGTVPAGESVRFEIHGSQVGCEPGERASWQEGRLLINGEPFVVTSDDGWC